MIGTTSFKPQANIMDEIHDELDQRVFSGIDPRPNKIKFIRNNFLDGIKSLVPNAEDYFTMYLTGSLTTYQYSDNSDCDISIFPDYDKLIDVMKVANANEVRKALISVVIQSIDGVMLPGTQHPIQHFVVLTDNKPEDLYQPGMRSAWSFQTESWFVAPEKDRVHNVKQELPLIYLRAHAIADKLRVVLETDPIAAKRLFQRVHIKRTEDQRAGRGDFSEGNVVYKYLLHEGLFDRLREIGIYIAKVDPQITSATDETQIIYDFTKDRIILGTKAEAAALPSGVLVGSYKDGHATMYEAAHQWMNTTYFKKLWYHSFPTWPLSGITFHGPKGPQRVGAEQPQDIAYVQAFVFVDAPVNRLLTDQFMAEHQELLENFIDASIDFNTQNGEDPAAVEDQIESLLEAAPKTAGHVGRIFLEGHSWDTPYSAKVGYVAVFFSDFLSNKLTPGLKKRALNALEEYGFAGIEEAPSWAYQNTKWYTS